jgi:hypothetical protein
MGDSGWFWLIAIVGIGWYLWTETESGQKYSVRQEITRDVKDSIKKYRHDSLKRVLLDSISGYKYDSSSAAYQWSKSSTVDANGNQLQIDLEYSMPDGNKAVYLGDGKWKVTKVIQNKYRIVNF